MKNCRICLFIRYFIVSVIFIIISSIIFVDDLGYFAFVTPWNAVKVIFFLGFLLVIYKLFENFKKDQD